MKILFLKTTKQKVISAAVFRIFKTCSSSLFSLTVFSMGNNAYGQCGRRIVEDEVYRCVLKQSCCLVIIFPSFYSYFHTNWCVFMSHPQSHLLLLSKSCFIMFWGFMLVPVVLAIIFMDCDIFVEIWEHKTLALKNTSVDPQLAPVVIWVPLR